MVDPAGEERFRGPPAAYVRHLDFDGANVAWSVDGWVLVAAASGRHRTIPAGPCVRTQAAFTSFSDGLWRRSIRLGARCLSAPAGRCRLDARVYAGRRVARLVTTVRVGAEPILRIPLSRTGL